MKHLTEAEGPPLKDTPAPSWIFDRIEEWARKFPKRFAFAIDRQDRVDEYTYTDVLKQADAFAGELAARGLKPGDRIGILMENIPEWVFVLLGGIRFGAVTVPLPTTLPESHLVRIVKHAGCRVLFTDKENHQKAAQVVAEVDAELVDIDEPRRKKPPETTFRGITDGDTTVLLIYTSGTTGDPKGVQLSMLNLVYEIRGIVEPLEFSAEHRILSVLPFSHVLPLVANGLGPLCLGAGVVFLSSISPQRIVEAFQRHRITCFVCVPQFFYLLHKRIFSQVEAQPWFAKKMFNVMRRVSKFVGPEIRRKLFSRIHKAIGPDLRLLASGGSRFDSHIAADLTDLGYTMLNAYGLTETSAAVTATPVRDNRLGSVGKPIRGVTIRIDSPNAEGIGEIWIKGPLLMKGYYHDPHHTAEVMSGEWFRSGDLGFIDGQRNLTITGRSKDVIVLASGKNIYPEEIESHYAKSPFIKELCVLGVSANGDGPAGERLHAVVVPDMDEFRRRGQAAIMEMIKFEMDGLSKDLPSYQRVLSLSIRNEPFPRTVTRKLKRFEIEKEEAARQKAVENRASSQDHARFTSGIGEIVASLIRREKPDVGGLSPDLNIELDLGFDSLARIELLTEIESRTGIHLEDTEVTRIYTLGELLDAIEQKNAGGAKSGPGWKEILSVSTADNLNDHYIFKPKPVAVAIIVFLSRALLLLSKVVFHYRAVGIENVPKDGPYLMCPNHESYLDAPMLYATLPSRTIGSIFSLGYSDYWEGPISRRISELCNIVAIDPNVNLVRAMQAGAVGLKRSKVLLIFPEGTRTIDGRLQEFKKGAAILAYEMGVPILPVGINGTFEMLPRSGGFKFHPIEIVFGKLIDPRDFAGTADPYAALTDALRDRVSSLRIPKEKTA